MKVIEAMAPAVPPDNSADEIDWEDPDPPA